MKKQIKEKQGIRNNKAITLIALVVTIVVLLILAGVSISMLGGENGIIKQAQDSKEDTRGGAVKEERNLWVSNVRLDKTTGSATAEGKDEIIGRLQREGLLTADEVTEINNGEIINIGSHEIDFNLFDVKLPSGKGTTPYLPSSYYIPLDGTDLSTGLVIRDSLGNEYVWIEVPRTATVYDEIGTEITEFTDEEYVNIEEALKEYTTTYRNSTAATDEYYSDEVTGLTEEQYNNLKKTMLKSVYQNGGFWLGRYEAGIEVNRTSNTTIVDDLKPLSQANQYPLTYVTCSQAQELASRISTSGYTSSLMFGVQWDLVLKYLETKAIAQGIDETVIKGNSSEWGNYRDHLYNITNTSAKYSTNGGTNWKQELYNKAASASVLLTTGASEKFSKQNIYDLAGNVYEFTLEDANNDPYGPCSYRGGGYNHSGLTYPAKCRNGNATTYTDKNIGFRVTLY